MRHDPPETGEPPIRALIARARDTLDRIGARSPSDLRAFAARLSADRRKRERFFPTTRFSDPAWDLLLELYACGTMSVSSACIASTAPATTGLRHLVALEQGGLVDRTADGSDGRRVLVRLSAKGEGAMESYLLSILSDG